MYMQYETYTNVFNLYVCFGNTKHFGSITNDKL